MTTYTTHIRDLETALTQHYPEEFAQFPVPAPESCRALEALVGPLGPVAALYEWRNGSGTEGFLKGPTEDVLDGRLDWYDASEAASRWQEWQDLAAEDPKLAKKLPRRMLPLFTDGSGDAVFVDLDAAEHPLFRLDHETRRWTAKGTLPRALEGTLKAVKRRTWTLPVGADPLSSVRAIFEKAPETWSDTEANQVFLVLHKAAERGLDVALAHRHLLPLDQRAVIEVVYYKAQNQPESLMKLFLDPAVQPVLLQYNQIQTSVAWFAKVGRPDLALQAYEITTPLTGEGELWPDDDFLDAIRWLQAADAPRAQRLRPWMYHLVEAADDEPHVQLQGRLLRAKLAKTFDDREGIALALDQARTIAGGMKPAIRKVWAQKIEHVASECLSGI